MATISSRTFSDVFSFFQDVFVESTPDLPSQRLKGDAIDVVAGYSDPKDGSGYLETRDGCWDLARLAELMTRVWQAGLGLNPNAPTRLNQFQQAAGTASLAFAVPSAFSAINQVRHNLSDLKAAVQSSDDTRSVKIARAVKKSFFNLAWFTNDCCQVTVFLTRIRALDLSDARLKGVDVLANGTGVILDGTELIGEYYKLSKYTSLEKKASPAYKVHLGYTKTLSWIVIAKDIAGIAGSFLALTGLLARDTFEKIPFAATAALTCSVLWLSLKITAHFYQKLAVDVRHR